MLLHFTFNLTGNSNNNNNTQQAAIATLPLTTHPQQWAEPHTFTCKSTLWIHVHAPITSLEWLNSPLLLFLPLLNSPSWPWSHPEETGNSNEQLVYIHNVNKNVGGIADFAHTLAAPLCNGYTHNNIICMPFHFSKSTLVSSYSYILLWQWHLVAGSIYMHHWQY